MNYFRTSFHILLLSAIASAFCPQQMHSTTTNLSLKVQNTNFEQEPSRRQALKSAFLSIALMAPTTQRVLAVDDDLTRGGVKLSPFNGLAFQYRGNANNGLDASTLSEPSIPYMEFLERMDKGEVEFVEFMAPNGDAAYVTFKSKEGEGKQKPIRIGDGYPIEDPEGWSSPSFVVKAVQKKGVPFKFTVPALAAYKTGL